MIWRQRVVNAIRKGGLVLAVIGVMGIPGMGRASLIGDDIRLQAFFDFDLTPISDQTAVGDSTLVEFTDATGLGVPLSVDILDDDSIAVALEGDVDTFVELQGIRLVFSDVDWGGAGTVVGLENFVATGLETTFGGFELLSPTSFALDDIDIRVSPDNQLATLTFEVVSAHSEVPEPTSLMLLGSALMGLAISCRRR